MSRFLREITDENGVLIPTAIAKQFHVSIEDIATLVDLKIDSLQTDDLIQSETTQTRLREMVKIIEQVIPWCENTNQAYEWYRNESLTSFNDLTAMTLINQGKTDAVVQYLERIDKGGFS